MLYLSRVITMKEKIYTIPVNEAFDTDCECALCGLRKKLELEAVDYSLGGAMMEPDYRIVSNEKGYCNKHYAMMLTKKEKLSLALIMDTHLNEIQQKLNSLKEAVENAKSEKKPLFKKSTDGAKQLGDAVECIEKSCVICEKLDHTMDRYISVIFYLWEKEAEFRDKLTKSKGFCLPHFNELVKGAYKNLSSKKAAEFAEIIYKKEKEELERIQSEVHKFTLKFDYRNRNEKWGTEIDAPKRTAEKLSGYITDTE